MAASQDTLSVLNDPLAQELLNSTTPAHLAYSWTDGTPRVVPIWFQWTGKELVFCSVVNAAKLKAIVDGSKVAVTIDGNVWPYKVLLIRGTVKTTQFDGVVPDYRKTAERYLGPEGAKGFIGAIEGTGLPMKRIGVTPTWVKIIDFVTRWPTG
jgi:hypothetical protein